MASAADIDADLTLEINGTNVTPEKFMRCVRAFFGLISEVTRTRAAPADSVSWTVQVKSGSNLIGLTPNRLKAPAAVLDNIIASVQEGLAGLETDAEDMDRLPESALKHVRDLASVVGTDEVDDTRVRVWTKKYSINVTHKAVAQVANLLQEAYEDFGTLDGRVQVISDQGNLHVFVIEPLRARRVRCYFDESMLPVFMAAFRKRVEVSGRIKYRRDGTPISIQASGLIEFPESTKLPTFRDMRGIFREGA